MTRRVILRPAAEEEVRDAHDGYEQRRGGLGDEFILCIDAALEPISRSPEAHPRVHEQTRRVLVRRFPYAVFNVIEPDAVVVLAVFHGRMDPLQWQRRRR